MNSDAIYINPLDVVADTRSRSDKVQHFQEGVNLVNPGEQLIYCHLGYVVTNDCGLRAKTSVLEQHKKISGQK